MTIEEEQPEKRPLERHVREETVRINGAEVRFFRCPNKRRWVWRVVDAIVELPVSANVTVDANQSKAQDTN